MDKYEMLDETKTTEDGIVLHRIRALRDIQNFYVRKGDLGGWIESEDNLSQDGDAWVGGDAMVYGNAWVCDDAQVSGTAVVSENAWVSDDAEVGGDAQVSGTAWVYDDAEVGGSAEIFGGARVCSLADYSVFKNTWSSGRWFTYTRSNKKWKVGCFLGTGDELIKKAYADSATSGRCYEAIVRAVEAIENATAGEGGAK